MKYKLKNKAAWILFAVYFLFLFVLHGQVFLYFDDYGYGSLSYGYSVGTNGLHYGFADIITYLGWHYLNWGGRVLYFFLEICSIKMGLEFIQAIQTLIIWGIGFFSYLLVKDGKSTDLYKALLSVFLFGTLGLNVFNRGIFWFSASVSYVWPLLPLLVLVYLRRILREKYSAVMVVCAVLAAFLAAFSYEQIAVLAFVYVVTDFAIARIQGRIAKYDWGILGVTICGAALELLAPGNFVRSSDPRYSEFYEMSIWGKMGDTLPKLLEMNFGVDNCFMVIVLILAGFLAILYCSSKRLYLWLGMVVYSISSGALLFLWKIETPIYISVGCRMIWVTVFLLYMITMLWKMRSFDLCALFIGGLCAEGMMLLTPTLPERCMIPFDFVIFIVIAASVGTGRGQYKMLFPTVFVCITGVLSIVNMSDIVKGYSNNYAINMINDNKLREKSMRIAAGEDIGTIILYRLPDDAYAADMPYQQQYMEYWMKNYYEIPQEIQFVWENMNNIGTTREMVVSEKPKILSIYPELIDDTTQYNEDGSLNIGVTPEIMSNYLQIMINGEIYNTVIDRGFVSTSVTKDMLENEYLEISLFDQSSGEQSDRVEWRGR